LLSGTDRAFALAGNCGIPPTARVLSVNMTVVGSTAPGFLTLLPEKTLTVTTSGINFGAGQTRANNAFVQLAPDGSGSILVRPFVAGGGRVDFILDVNGYFE
jgi:hypothetical protein